MPGPKSCWRNSPRRDVGGRFAEVSAITSISFSQDRNLFLMLVRELIMRMEKSDAR
jgi:hypothetical protein